MGRPHECASSTAAWSSSSVNAVKSTEMFGVTTPPVAMTLMLRAPPFIWSRTAWRRATGPSQARAKIPSPWPPVIVRATPEAITRGPATIPSSMAGAPEVPDGGRAALQVPEGVPDRLDRGPPLGQFARLGHDVGGTVEAQMHV